MLSYLAGLIIFLLLFASKWALSKAVLGHKHLAWCLFSILLCETAIVLILYTAIVHMELSGIEILAGFLVALLAMFGYFGLVFFKKTNKGV